MGPSSARGGSGRCVLTCDNLFVMAMPACDATWSVPPVELGLPPWAPRSEYKRRVKLASKEKEMAEKKVGGAWSALRISMATLFRLSGRRMRWKPPCLTTTPRPSKPRPPRLLPRPRPPSPRLRRWRTMPRRRQTPPSTTRTGVRGCWLFLVRACRLGGQPSAARPAQPEGPEGPSPPNPATAG